MIKKLWKEFLLSFTRKRCPYCDSYSPGLIMEEEVDGFSTRVCTDEFHDGLLKRLEDLYNGPDSSGK